MLNSSYVLSILLGRISAIFRLERTLVVAQTPQLEYSEAELTFQPQIMISGDPAICRRNMEIFAIHGIEENSGEDHLDAAMATIHRDEPFQIFHCSGLEVRGFENVREFYRKRMSVWSGRAAFPHRIFVSESYAVINGYYKQAPCGDFFGIETWGKPLFFPFIVWVYFKEGLVWGEVGYWDGDTVRRQAREGAIGDATQPLR